MSTLKDIGGGLAGMFIPAFIIFVLGAKNGWWEKLPKRLSQPVATAKVPEPPGAVPLRTAQKAADAAGQKHLAGVRKYFAERADCAPRFAARATGWDSTWEYVKSGFTIVGNDWYGHDKFIRREFEAAIFTAADVQKVLDQAVAEFRRDLERVDGQFVVDLRHDVPDSALLSKELIAKLQAGDTFRQAYGQLLEEVGAAVERDVGGSVARELSGFYLGNLAAGGVLRVGAAAGLAVGGWVPALVVNVGLGVVIDQIIQWALKQVGFDPAADVEAAVRRVVADVRDRLVDGEPAAVARYDALRAQQAQAGDPAGRKKLADEADALALSGKLGLARQFALMQAARSAVRAEIAKLAMAARPAATGQTK
ncbi:MAG: hypothetical protein U0871_04755 [Gemmataceae bacterium]